MLIVSIYNPKQAPIYGIIFIFFKLSKLSASAWKSFNYCGSILEELGLEESPNKVCEPATVVTCLGIQFDTTQKNSVWTFLKKIHMIYLTSNRITCLSNLERSEFKKFLWLPNWTRPMASSNFGIPRNFFRPIISKFDSMHVILLPIHISAGSIWHLYTSVQYVIEIISVLDICKSDTLIYIVYSTYNIH